MKNLEKKIKNLNFKKEFNKFIKFSLKNKSLILVILFSITFSTWLMGSTFGYQDGNITMGDKLWSDFNSHLPLIRSFSYGDNTPLEYPLFTGEKIRYHFLFYFLVGMLEKMGLRIDVALNLLSIIGMAGLMISLYLLAIKITKSKFAGWLSVFFLIFNSSLSWIYFILKHPFDNNFFPSLFSDHSFASFGPYDDNIITAFWNLNIFTNQRHLAFSFFMMFIAVWGIAYSKKKFPMVIGLAILGIMPWLHKAILMILIVILSCLFLAMRGQRKRIFLGLIGGIILAIPGLSYLAASTNASDIKIWLGYIYNSTSWKELPGVEKGWTRWIVFWFLNLGLLPVLSFLGWFIVESTKKSDNKFVKKIWNKLQDYFSNPIQKSFKLIWKISKRLFDFVFNPERVWGFIALIIFIIGNLFTFAADISTNHKLFNFTSMILGIYAAFYITYLFRKEIILKLIAVIFIIFMVVGGFVDLFPIINENQAVLADIPNNKTSQWIVNNTDPKAKFLNLTSDTFTVSLAGRRIYFGGEYLNWSIGYPTLERRTILSKIAAGRGEKPKLCSFLLENNLDYIFLSTNERKFVDTDIDFRYYDDNFVKEDIGDSLYKIYNTQKSCN